MWFAPLDNGCVSKMIYGEKNMEYHLFPYDVLYWYKDILGGFHMLQN